MHYPLQSSRNHIQRYADARAPRSSAHALAHPGWNAGDQRPACPRDRELVILRVALRTECAYEWTHVLLALDVGVTEA